MKNDPGICITWTPEYRKEYMRKYMKKRRESTTELQTKIVEKTKHVRKLERFRKELTTLNQKFDRIKAELDEMFPN
jgi:hypothetical protein